MEISDEGIGKSGYVQKLHEDYFKKMTHQSQLLLPFVMLICLSCSKQEKTESDITKYNDIFGEWKVTHAEFIRGEKYSYNKSLDDKSLEASDESYIYSFRRDSTFERGKPNYKHGNVEEAHGRFSLSKDKKVMKWYQQWDNQERVDTTDIQIIAITPIKIVMLESSGAHSMLQILKRIDSDSTKK